jgi:FixJ family two-component response regulator
MPRCHGDALVGAVVSSTELPEKEVGKCPCGRLYGLSAGEERIHFPGRSGLELQRDLAAANRQVPIIFIAAHADVPMTVQAMKGGAIEFLTKPFRDQDLLDAVEAGLARDRARRESERASAALRERFDTLSSRERDIMLHVVAGRLNKQIANDIGIAESTVKVHRTT